MCCDLKGGRSWMHKVLSSQYTFEDLYPWRYIWRNIPLKISCAGMWHDENYMQGRIAAQVGRLVGAGPWGEQEVLFLRPHLYREHCFRLLSLCVCSEWPVRSCWMGGAGCSAVQGAEEPTSPPASWFSANLYSCSDFFLGFHTNIPHPCNSPGRGPWAVKATSPDFQFSTCQALLMPWYYSLKWCL